MLLWVQWVTYTEASVLPCVDNLYFFVTSVYCNKKIQKTLDYYLVNSKFLKF